MKRKMTCLVIVSILLSILVVPVFADSYSIVIRDDANLLGGEEETVRTAMEPIAEQYANVMFLTSEAATYDNVESIAEQALRSTFGDDSSVVFYIDMYQRELTVYSIGAAYRALGSRAARSITANVYSLASEGNYAGCAFEAFRQILSVLNGSRITAPVQHVVNAMMALMIGFLIVYFYVVRSRVPEKKVDPSIYNPVYDAKKTTAKAAAMASVPAAVLIGNHLLRTSRVRKSRSGGASGFGGGGGGGASGGGGSHRF